MVLVFWYSSQDWNNWVLTPLLYIKVEVQQNLMLNSVLLKYPGASEMAQ